MSASYLLLSKQHAHECKFLWLNNCHPIKPSFSKRRESEIRLRSYNPIPEPFHKNENYATNNHTAEAVKVPNRFLLNCNERNVRQKGFFTMPGFPCVCLGGEWQKKVLLLNENRNDWNHRPSSASAGIKIRNLCEFPNLWKWEVEMKS